MSKPKKITTNDIAREAGVSQSTVSMILNEMKRSSFSEETVGRVLETAERMGYRGKRKTAQRRAQRASDTIAVFCPVLSNPYYATVVQAIELAASRQGFRTVVCTTYRDMDTELRHLAAIEDSDAAGIVFTSIPLHIQRVEKINKKIPVVVIGDRDDLINVDTVEVNSYRSGIALAEYLMELGHRRVAFLSSSLNNQNTIRIKRMEGLRDALAKAGPESSLVVKSVDITTIEDNADFDIERKIGWRLAMECMEQETETAVVAVNDMVAYGALDALREKGFRVPEDYSVCGFDNVFPSRLSGIQLTSIDNHMVQKGENAVKMLIKRIKEMEGQVEHQNQDIINRIEYQPHLIIRETTGPAAENIENQLKMLQDTGGKPT